VTFHENDTVNVSKTDLEPYDSVLIEPYDLMIADTVEVTDEEVTAIPDIEPEAPENELIEVDTGVTDKKGPGRSENEVEEAETLETGDQESDV
jgi:hypothetical protein